MTRKLVCMTLKKRRAAFDDPSYVFELKYDGFRSLFVCEKGVARFYSRNGHHMSRFDARAQLIQRELRAVDSVMDGELVCVDRQGRPMFWKLLSGDSDVRFFAFDLLKLRDKDWCGEALLARKQALRRFLPRRAARIHYVSHLRGLGVRLFELVCTYDLEGLVAKKHDEPYAPTEVVWWKIKNPDYSQGKQRWEWFARRRAS